MLSATHSLHRSVNTVSPTVPSDGFTMKWPSRGGRRISSSTAAYPRRPSSLDAYSSNAYRLPAGSAPAGSTRLGRLSDAATGNASSAARVAASAPPASPTTAATRHSYVTAALASARPPNRSVRDAAAESP